MFLLRQDIVPSSGTRTAKDCPPSCPVWFGMDLRMAFRDLFWEKIWWMKSPVSETCALTGVQLTCCAEKKFQVLSQILPGRRDGSLSRSSSSFNTVWEGYFLHFKMVFLVSCWEKKMNSNKPESFRQGKKRHLCYPSHTNSESLPDPGMSLTLLLGKRERVVACNDWHWNKCKMRVLSFYQHKSIREESRRNLLVLVLYFPELWFTKL